MRAIHPERLEIDQLPDVLHVAIANGHVHNGQVCETRRDVAAASVALGVKPETQNIGEGIVHARSYDIPFEHGDSNYDAIIAARLWEDPTFRADFVERIKWVLDDVWDAPTMIAQADRLADLIRADGLTGSREFVTMSEFENSLADRKDFVTRRADEVRAQLAAWESGDGAGEEP